MVVRPMHYTKSTGLSLGQLTGVFACVLVRTSCTERYILLAMPSIGGFRSLGDLSAKLSSVLKPNRDASPTSSFSSEPTGSKRP